MRNYSHSNAPVSCGESAVHKALGAEGAYWNIGIGPHAAYTAFRQTGQHTPRAFTGPGKLSVRGYQSYNSFVKSYQYGWVVKGVSFLVAMLPAFQWISTSVTVPNTDPGLNCRGRPSRFDCETALRLLVGANVVAWINWQLDPAFMANHFMTSLNHIREGRWYTIVTACFSHRDPLHLFGNMLTLYFFWNRAFSGRLVSFHSLAFTISSVSVNCSACVFSWPMADFGPAQRL